MSAYRGTDGPHPQTNRSPSFSGLSKSGAGGEFSSIAGWVETAAECLLLYTELHSMAGRPRRRFRKCALTTSRPSFTQTCPLMSATSRSGWLVPLRLRPSGIKGVTCSCNRSWLPARAKAQATPERPESGPRQTNHSTKRRMRNTKNALAAKARYSDRSLLLLPGVHKGNADPKGGGLRGPSG